MGIFTNSIIRQKQRSLFLMSAAAAPQRRGAGFDRYGHISIHNQQRQKTTTTNCIFISSVFVENMALALFLGMCTFLAVSKKVDTSVSLGVAVGVLIQVGSHKSSEIEIALMAQHSLAL